MKNIYLQFYEQRTRKLNKDILGDLDLTEYTYLMYEDPFYILKPDILIGRLDHKKTFGFLRQELEDIYLEQRDMMDAMHDDIVLVKEGVEPRIVYIVKRALSLVVATVNKTKRGLFFEPDTYIDRRLEVEEFGDLVLGHVVMLEVESIDKFAVYAKVKKIIGHVNDPDINTLKIVASYDWPQTFSEEVMKSIHDIKIDFEHYYDRW